MADGSAAARPRCLSCLAFRPTISLALFAAALWLSSADVAWEELASLRWTTLLACGLLSLSIIPLLAVRWRLIARSMAPDRRLPPLPRFMGLTWAGLATNQILPSFIGGDALRLALLTRSGVAAQLAAGSVVVDRATGFAGLVLVGGAAAVALGGALAESVLHASILFAAFAAASGALLLIASNYSRRVARLARLLRGAASPGTLLAASLVSALGHFANIGVFLVLAWAFGVGLPILPTVCLLSTVLLATALPVSINGWGVRELTLVQAFGYIGVASDRILLVSVAYGLLHLFIQSCGFLFATGRHQP